MYQLGMAKITSGSSFEPINPTEQKLGVCLRALDSEMTSRSKFRLYS